MWLGLAAPAHADIGSVASVIDGDTVESHGGALGLGADAPESGQPWLDETGQKWRRVQQAALALYASLAAPLRGGERRKM